MALESRGQTPRQIDAEDAEDARMFCHVLVCILGAFLPNPGETGQRREKIFSPVPGPFFNFHYFTFITQPTWKQPNSQVIGRSDTMRTIKVERRGERGCSNKGTEPPGSKDPMREGAVGCCRYLPVPASKYRFAQVPSPQRQS